MNLRKATSEDLEELAKLGMEFHRDHELILAKDKKAIPFDKKNKDIFLINKNFIKKYINSKKGEVFLVEDNKKIVAYSLLIIHRDSPILENKYLGVISDIFVKKEYRNKKISSMLYEESIKWFKKNKIELISLNVNPNNPAHKIYKKWGFFDFMINMRKRLE